MSTICDICYAYKVLGEKCDHKCKVLDCENEFTSHSAEGYCEDHRCHFDRGYGVWDKPPKCCPKTDDEKYCTNHRCVVDGCKHQISKTFRPVVKCDSCGPLDDKTEPEVYQGEDPVKYRERALRRRAETTYVDHLWHTDTWTPFCAHHLCKQFGCPERVWKRTDFCKKHGLCHCGQPKARRRNMHHRCLMACEAHLCQGMSYDPLFDTEKALDKSGGFVECSQLPVKDRKFCQRHLCSMFECPNPKAVDKDVCVEHMCQSPECSKEVCQKFDVATKVKRISKFCFDHTCQYILRDGECLDLVVEGYYCPRHTVA